MTSIYYDLHIHSCLSPCAHNDMTVNNIVSMALIKGLDIIALTDHNSSKNCPAFMDAAKNKGIIALPGMELSTMEEVHTVCIFKSLENAMAFDRYVYNSLPDIKNRPEIFGEQYILNAEDEIVGIEEKLLINASSISFYDLQGLMDEFKGVYFPAHIDRESFSLLSNLGSIPPDCSMDAVEIKEKSKYESIIKSNPIITDLPLLINSDAHYLWDLSEAENILKPLFLNLLDL